MAYYFYLVRCSDGTLYAGSTTDPSKRITMHNAGKGAKYTRSRGPVALVYLQKFRSKSFALKREYEVKQWKKSCKEALVSSGTMKI